MSLSTTDPVVSVVMSVYNGERYVAQAIRSILKQTFSNFEFIIINDGSTDRTDPILKKFAKKDDRILVLDQDNQGLARALNRGILIAKGRYIARMDADDISLPKRLEKQVQFLDKNLAIAAVGSSAIVIDEFGFRLARWDMHVDHEDIDRHNMKGFNGGMIHPSVMMRKDVLLKIGCYNASLRVAQDYDLWLRLAEVSKLSNLQEYCIKYRRSLNSLSIFHQKNQAKAASQIYITACKRRKHFDYLNVNENCFCDSDFSLNFIDIRKKWIAEALYFGYWDGFLAQKIMLAISEMTAGQGLPLIKKLTRIAKQRLKI